MRDLAALLGGSAAGLFGLWFLLMMGISAAFPFIVYSVLRNVSRSRVALERIATALESGQAVPDASQVMGLSRISVAPRARETA